MPDGYEGQETRQEAEFAPTGRRVMAGVWDILFVGVLTILIFMLLGISPFVMDIIVIMIFMLVLGIIHMILAAGFEASRQRTIGKYIEGIEVFSLTGEPVTGGQAFARNVSKFFFIAYLIDIAGGMGAQPTQKLSDAKVDTVLIISMATVIRKPRKKDFPYKSLGGGLSEEERKRCEQYIKQGYLPGDENLPPEEQRRRLMEYLRKVGYPLEGALGKEMERQRMIDHLKHGRCSRCSSPFRILQKGDTSFSGLWNSRCTWCNKTVFEDDFKSKIEPGFKPDTGYRDMRGAGFKDWEQGSYMEWEKKRGGGIGGEREERSGGIEPGFKP